MICSHINLIVSMFHQSGHIRFLIYVYLHTKQHFLIFYVFVAICFGLRPFFKQTTWTIEWFTTVSSLALSYLNTRKEKKRGALQKQIMGLKGWMDVQSGPQQISYES